MTTAPPALPGRTWNKRLKESRELACLLLGMADMRVARGKAVYDQHCASCHGAKLEGQPNWRKPLPNGKWPAPPHDPTGHTWHHSDKVLFKVTKYGMQDIVPDRDTDMPGFKDILSDAAIWAVLSYIESTWPPEI